MIHVLDFNDKIIDFLSTDDPSLVRAIHKRNVNDNSEMLELLISSERAEKFRERHRVIIRDSNKQWREFIINWVQDTMDGYTEIECIASYLADITTAKPYAPGKFEKKITSEALKDVLSDTGWEVSEQTEYDGLRTTSWTSYQTRYEVLKQLCTTYKMVLDFYIELSSNTVKGRYVVLKKKNSLFKGKEIEYGKDLVGLTRKIDMSEIKTALIAVGPENDKGKRLELVVTDDEAQSQFNLPTRYIWGIYEPQSDDQNMNETRLRSLAKTELNKRKSAVMSYEITSTDLEVTYPHEIISIGDTVRVKHRDFNPPLYVEAEVIAEEYNIISENSTYTFGQPKEFKESELREEFNKRLNIIHQKLNDNISNINTIVKDVVDSELEYFERKIHKSDTPPENPVNDMLWYDTSNPDVAVLRRYWNGRWIEETPNDVEKLGGIIREKALFSELNNIFINLSIQHASLLSEATELLNSEYLVDNDLKADLQASLDAVIDVYNQIKNNLESMTPETATIGRLVDTKTLFLEYRKKLQDVYTDVEDVKIAISDRFKLLQSQYTDEKYKEALEIIATKFGLTVNEDLQLVGEPNVVKSAIEAARESTKEQLRDYVKTSDYKTDKDGIVERLDTAEAERTTLKGEIKDKVTLNEYRNGLEEQKQYTDDQLSDLSNNPEIKASIEQANQEAQEALKSYIDAQDDLKEKESQAYADGKISEEEQRAIQDAQAKLEEAKQNAELKARNAEKKANAYTDNKVKESTDAQRKTLTRYGSQIIQNGKEIKLRTTKEEFNASKRTLSRVLADITVNAMKGIYLRYDENGAITSHTIDKDGVKISGDKVDITANREFNVVANNINNKVGKNDIVNSLNLSNEGLDINVNRIGIKGGNANRYVQVQNDFIELGGIVQRTWKGKRSTDDIFTRLKDGHLRFRNNTAGGSLYMSHFGISTYIDGEGEDGGSSGTIQWWDKTYSDSGMNGITINSYGGVVALTSDYNRIIIDSYASANIESREAPIYLSPNTKNKPGLNRFAFTLSNADSAYETDGYIMFGSDENYKYGAGLRFSKRSNKGLVQVVNGDYATGGDTTIESGMGKFNLVKRRDGNSYVSIQSYDLLAVGSDNAGDRVASNSIYKRTYSAPANLHITSAGTIGRATSAKKYKISIENQYINEDDQFSHSKEILKLPIRTWFDKYESEIMAKELESGKKLSDDTFKLSRHTGLIAEEVEELGFNEFVIYDDNGEIEGIAYDRLWVHLIPIIKNQQSKIEKLEELINE
ncbi:phage tail spike protein [Staphylococcus aureus]|uniref:Minor structural protein n=1 Tax=Staphylococcus phage JS01 TaxID=1273712 RepID=R9QT86_9CAUD|nr:phage tail spike protein [Staphylococcus aureus]YP_008239493.1 minor head protein [Staphylococcus phage JS01]AGC35436.1 minor structural protein [Staphylococcus phage JS01]AYV00095.1 Structural protein, phage associated [Staphylococcus aureus]AYV02544.1 Structural protein, phage associated [Staphylococcus aureus]KIR00693.1 phage minor structural protein [Staphylococcus aureus]KIT66451.1 phage minor structural protein [Staphylococcus aureus]